MRVLCCLDGFNIEHIKAAVTTFLHADAEATGATLTIGLLYVTDIGPHLEMERRRERALRPRQSGPLRREQMEQAEQFATQDILDEGKRYFRSVPQVELLRREGRPEREIVNLASEWNADIIVICPRSPRGGEPRIGPKSIGHVARFVLDHAPCPVLLVRQPAPGHFPLER